MQTIEEYLISLARRRARPLAKKMAGPIAEKMTRVRTRRVADQTRAATLRANLRQLIETRFKTRPANLDTLLADADATTLQKWFDAALTARSARAVFASH